MYVDIEKGASCRKDACERNWAPPLTVYCLGGNTKAEGHPLRSFEELGRQSVETDMMMTIMRLRSDTQSHHDHRVLTTMMLL